MKGGRSKAQAKDSKLSVKKTTKQPAKKGKEVKDPNKPKRPASAFFVFMEDFRKQYKEKHPNNKSVAAVGKAGGDKWKTMSAAEKAPYVAKSEKRKTEYNKNIEAYNKKQGMGGMSLNNMPGYNSTWEEGAASGSHQNIYKFATSNYNMPGCNSTWEEGAASGRHQNIYKFATSNWDMAAYAPQTREKVDEIAEGPAEEEEESDKSVVNDDDEDDDDDEDEDDEE